MNPFFNWLKETGTQAMLVLVGTAAACIAAIGTIYFGRKSLTKKDLAPVEEHTAATSHHLEKLSERSTRTDELDALMYKASSVPIVARGTADKGQPLTIYLKTNDPTVLFSRVELLNDMGSHYGKAECSRTTNSMEFSFTLDSDAVAHWRSGSHPIGGDTHLYIRVYMFLEGAERELDRQVHVVSKVGILKPYVITIEGSV